MNKKKLTLLIALSISIIAIICGSMMVTSGDEAPASVASNTNEKKTESIVASSSEAVSSIVVKEEKTEEKVEKPTTKKKTVTKKKKVKLKPYSISPNASSFKSWMPYTAITNRASAAYKLQKKAYTDKNGLRKINDDYCVAMGTFYSSKIGERFKVTMSTGKTFTVIISDIKSNKHTDSTHRYTVSNGCMMEFLIDKNCLNSKIRTSGSVGSLKLFSGKFVKIEKLS